ncbi:2Fe-2S iron-sulfur cluster-binding protein [Microbulbifer sp. TYP-18]|uniref:2Fe-2S iron-sulfur cluster-binding protein n=1 Tax=Microbulbifer sp. TYP-18 TaxID=3230024 RepID=UPI0034C6AFD4
MTTNKQTDTGSEDIREHRIVVKTPDGGDFTARSDRSLLVAMEQAGKSFIAVGCRGGGCGKCRIRILRGDYVGKRMSSAWVTPEMAAEGTALACRVFPRSDMLIEPAPPEIGVSRHTMDAPIVEDKKS